MDTFSVSEEFRLKINGFGLSRSYSSSDSVDGIDCYKISPLPIGSFSTLMGANPSGNTLSANSSPLLLPKLSLLYSLLSFSTWSSLILIVAKLSDLVNVCYFLWSWSWSNVIFSVTIESVFSSWIRTLPLSQSYFSSSTITVSFSENRL